MDTKKTLFVESLSSNPYYMPVSSLKKKKTATKTKNAVPKSFLAQMNGTGKSKTKKNGKGPLHNGNFAGKPLASSAAYKTLAAAPTSGNPLRRVKNDTALTTVMKTMYASNILELPVETLNQGVLSFLNVNDLVSFGATGRRSRNLIQAHSLWEGLFGNDFSSLSVTPSTPNEWQTVYKLASLDMMERNRCYYSKKTFAECILGVGLDYTVNPRTKCVDYISCSQDLLSLETFETISNESQVVKDTFGNQLKLFLPLYFSKAHFQRALPQLEKAIRKLCPERQTKGIFEPDMVLDVLPKIINSFVVLLSDEGVAASNKSFDALIRIHRIFVALADKYPSIRKEALSRLQAFVGNEENRSKKKVSSLGLILPLLMIVDENDFSWPKIRGTFLLETFDRCALWICRKNPFLEKIPKTSTMEEDEKRVDLSRQAMAVSMRLLMFHAFFLRFSNGTAAERSRRYDKMIFQEFNKEGGNVDGKMVLSVDTFRQGVNQIMLNKTYQQFFRFIGARGPSSIQEMAKLLEAAIKNSRRKKYHKAGMDFSRVQRGGASRLLAKGQQYSASSDLSRVVFNDKWGFNGSTKYLDATVLLMKGKTIAETIDYSNTSSSDGAVRHSGDQIGNHSGTHTIDIDLGALDKNTTSLVFVLSAWASATLSDISSASVAFRDAEASEEEEPLCQYRLQAHDKVASLTSVVMCKLYRKDDSWHVLAIGDAHKGDASNYGPIYEAVKKYV